MSAKRKPNELYISRVYDAPVKMVWDAWVDPKQVAQWWGPRGFTLTTRKKDVRTGGSWDYVMHGPDGKDWENRTKFLEVEKHSRLVYDHGANETQPPMFRVTVTFEDVGGKTKMDMTMALATADAAAETKKFIKKAGGDSTWDRLAEFLSQEKDKVDRFVTNRTFEAPIETVFEMWTNPKHLAQWMGPAGSTTEYLNADIRTGGTSSYKMVAGDPKAGGIVMYGKADYKEIQKPNWLVYTQYFVDESGNISRHPMAPTWPEKMLTTVTFTAETPEITRVQIVWEVYGEATKAERETFHTAKAGMTQGWAGSFDKLEEYLQNARN